MFVSPPLEEDLRLSGTPTARLHAEISGDAADFELDLRRSRVELPIVGGQDALGF